MNTFVAFMPKGSNTWLDPKGCTAGPPLSKLVRWQLPLLHGRIYDEETRKDSPQACISSWSGHGRQSLTPTVDYLKVLVQDFAVVAAFREPAVWNDLCFQPLNDTTPELIAVGLIANDCRKGGAGQLSGEDPGVTQHPLHGSLLPGLCAISLKVHSTQGNGLIMHMLQRSRPGHTPERTNPGFKLTSLKNV